MKYDDKTKLLFALSQRIKELRYERGLSQEDCLNDTGILFSRIELGTRNISFTTLHKICKYFGITLKEFFNDQFEELEG